MRNLEAGDKESRQKWAALLKKRRQTGEPYIRYRGNVNKQNPEAYKREGWRGGMEKKG